MSYAHDREGHLTEAQNAVVDIVLGNDVPRYLSRAALLTEEVDVFLGNKESAGNANEEDPAFIVPAAGKVWTA